ncbi:MAG: type II toxin-antitoxin system HicB family antitoxin [Selenomonadaceae bacterium]|nr:type II toxin-antitoxin system HicB family antitoxin [Selenomonadaceae bacterium]
MEYAFPAIFFPDDNCIGVYFYDMKDCVTFGRNFDEAVYMAEDLLNLVMLDAEEEGQDIPTPTEPKNIILDDKEKVVMIRADTEAYAAMLAKKNFNEVEYDDEVEIPTKTATAILKNAGFTDEQIEDILKQY